ncbi:MAG: hypothetical protein LBB83_04070 [Treponema sp.]|jgi:hypothetical protein|nr:hypothetical protein [Treponema sp.]
MKIPRSKREADAEAMLPVRMGPYPNQDKEAVLHAPALANSRATSFKNPEVIQKV